MINSIIEGISIRLKQIFGDEVYTEDVNPELPYFFISFLNALQSPKGANRYQKEYGFSIRYFPSGNEKNKKMNEVAEQLADVLENIELEDSSVRGTNIRYEAVEGVLHFFINYNVIVVKVKEEMDKMAELGIETGLKG